MWNPLRIAVVLFAVGIPLVAGAQIPGPPAPVLSTLVEGMPRGAQQEIRVIVATIKPGEKTPFHTHAFPVTVYVLEGTFTLEIEGRAPLTVKAGEAMVEPRGMRMTGYNRSASEPMRVVIFYVSDPGAPFLEIAHQ
jgi:quercetin dioxygenase-like cupin family protein